MRTAEKRRAIDEIHVFVAVRTCIVVGIQNDVAAFDVERVGIDRHEIGLGDHDIGKIGVRFSDHAVKVQMRFLQIFPIGCVVVVVANENAHGQLGNVACHAFLAKTVA